MIDLYYVHWVFHLFIFVVRCWVVILLVGWVRVAYWDLVFWKFGCGILELGVRCLGFRFGVLLFSV